MVLFFILLNFNIYNLFEEYDLKNTSTYVS